MADRRGNPVKDCVGKEYTVVNKPSSFLSGFFVGALASSAAALLFVFQPGSETRRQTDERTKASSSSTKRALDRYMEELGSWSGKGLDIIATSPKAQMEAPMGWY